MSVRKSVIRVIVIALIILANFILQSTFSGCIKILDVKPNTAILIVLIYAMLRGDVEGAMVGFFTGLLQDLFFGQFIGINALICALAGFAAGKPLKNFYRESYLLPLLLIFLFMFAYGFASYAGNVMFRGRTSVAYYFARVILPETIYTSLFALPLYRLIYLINAALERRERLFSGPFDE